MMNLKQTVTVLHQHGMHMVPCSLLAQLASDFDGEVRLEGGSHEADCKSIAELLLLGGCPVMC